MDISDFVKKAKEYNVLGIKISKDNELAAEWYITIFHLQTNFNIKY